ncbi:hypothetical protein T4D_11060 [Trichinella pseudospiralis]|uniref:Uncharacterized protein n=1 Tax=Trichinella pseudospiralis TaxID=6337 RepID=A0A0V1FII8_TRIPS|nr:hypothetical protein T4D_11060 [Trichinella pseudospiralis]
MRGSVTASYPRSLKLKSQGTKTLNLRGSRLRRRPLVHANAERFTSIFQDGFRPDLRFRLASFHIRDVQVHLASPFRIRALLLVVFGSLLAGLETRNRQTKETFSCPTVGILVECWAAAFHRYMENFLCYIAVSIATAAYHLETSMSNFHYHQLFQSCLFVEEIHKCFQICLSLSVRDRNGHLRHKNCHKNLLGSSRIIHHQSLFKLWTTFGSVLDSQARTYTSLVVVFQVSLRIKTRFERLLEFSKTKDVTGEQSRAASNRVSKMLSADRKSVQLMAKFEASSLLFTGHCSEFITFSISSTFRDETLEISH